jgi:periplasmic copper chaperone A
MKPIPARWLALSAVLLAASAAAHEYYADGFVFIHPWAEATAPGAKNAPVFFKLENVVKTDRLVSADAAFAERVELRPAAPADAPAPSRIDVPIGELVDFSPGHPHVLLVGLKEPLQWGRSYPMTFRFERAGPVQVMVSIGAH